MPADKIKDTRQAWELCEELQIEVLPDNEPMRFSPLSPARTNAVVTIQKIINLHGRDHAWAVLFALTQSENNRCFLTRAIIGAISDLFLSYPNWRERLGEFCDVLDAVDLEYLRQLASRAPGKDGRAPDKRTLIAGYLQQLFEPVMEPEDQEEMVA